MSVKNLEKIADMLETGTMLYMEKGMDNIDTQEMGCIIDMINDLAEAKYYCAITDAMEEAEYGEDYDEHGKKYYSRARDSRGRYMRRNYSEPDMRRGYEEPDMDDGNYQMTTRMYHEHSPEQLRDMDRRNGRMYYTEMNNSSSNSRYDNARRNYTESKSTHPLNDEENNKRVGVLADTIADDIRELKPKMSQSEKVLVRQKMMDLANELM